MMPEAKTRVLPMLVLGWLLAVSPLAQADSGEQLYRMLCMACHHRETQLDITAPSMLEIKASYRQVYPQRSSFVRLMAEWLLHPDEYRALMEEAVFHFDLMPALGLAPDQAEKVAGYIFDTDFRRFRWDQPEPDRLGDSDDLSPIQ